jgi:hypothetical protein
MKHYKHLTAIIEREGKGYVALCPEFDVASQGDTVEEARRNLTKAVEIRGFHHPPRGSGWVRFAPCPVARPAGSSRNTVFEKFVEKAAT